MQMRRGRTGKKKGLIGHDWIDKAGKREHAYPGELIIRKSDYKIVVVAGRRIIVLLLLLLFI